MTISGLHWGTQRGRSGELALSHWVKPLSLHWSCCFFVHFSVFSMSRFVSLEKRVVNVYIPRTVLCLFTGVCVLSEISKFLKNMYAHTVLLLTCGYRHCLWKWSGKCLCTAAYQLVDIILRKFSCNQSSVFVTVLAPWDSPHLCDVMENLSIYFRTREQGISEVSRLCWWCGPHNGTL